MNRRSWLQMAMVCISQVAAYLVGAGKATAQQTPDLSQTLRSVLKCRRNEEFAFVDLVVAKVDQGQLQASLVLSMMKWARERREDIPFPYFQEGIRKRAATLGVTL